MGLEGRGFCLQEGVKFLPLLGTTSPSWWPRVRFFFVMNRASKCRSFGTELQSIVRVVELH